MGRDHPIVELIHRRATAEGFDTARDLDEATIVALVRDATRAPSSFNIQHWRFLAVRRKEERERLCQAAYGQPQVRDAPVSFVVLGDVRGQERLPEILELAVARGALPEGKASAWLRMASQIYSDPTTARDEAIRSASLAAMTLMLSAEARGLACAALSGFDPTLVHRDFGIPERYVTVMLLAIGHPAPGSRPRMPRLDVSEVLALDRWTAV